MGGYVMNYTSIIEVSQISYYRMNHIKLGGLLSLWKIEYYELCLR